MPKEKRMMQKLYIWTTTIPASSKSNAMLNSVIIITLQLYSPLHFSVFSFVPSAVQHSVG